VSCLPLRLAIGAVFSYYKRLAVAAAAPASARPALQPPPSALYSATASAEARLAELGELVLGGEQGALGVEHT
jgi:hypothetical protein